MHVQVRGCGKIVRVKEGVCSVSSVLPLRIRYLSLLYLLTCYASGICRFCICSRAMHQVSVAFVSTHIVRTQASI